MDQNIVGDRGGNVSMTKGAIRQAQIAGHYNEVQIQNTVHFIVDGKYGTLAPVDNLNASLAAATYTGPSSTNVPACNVALFALWVTTGNVMSVTRGDLVDASKLGGTGGTEEKIIPFPAIEADKALIGLVKVKAGVGATFTYGTTNFNASNITATFYDTARMPVKPLTS